MKRDTEHFQGCLLGGALGDALGWSVEFLDLMQIRQKYGPEGILRAKVCGDQDATRLVGRLGSAGLAASTMTAF